VAQDWPSTKMPYIPWDSNDLGSPPTGASTLTATPGDNQVSLSWTAVTGADGGYRIWRGLASGAETPFAVEPTTSYVDSTAVNGTTYYYYVTALNGYGDGPLSNEDSATPTP